MLPPEKLAPALSGPDAWKSLSRFTPARIALGRSGGSQLTKSVLQFRLAHAQARDAVALAFDQGAIEQQLKQLGEPFFELNTRAANLTEFLARPDLGRNLSENSAALLEKKSAEWGQRDLAIILSNGLSALAAERQAMLVLQELLPLLRQAGWTIFPIFIAPWARVKLQDDVGARLGARHALILLGERPGLSAPDSLGAYFTYLPNPGRSDAERNCVSNIRAAGLPPSQAGRLLAALLLESAAQKTSGVTLRNTIAVPALPGVI